MGPRVLIVGGGHNGLVCAAYLARAGCRVTVLERRDVLGGACVTEDPWPGFRVSRAAYVVSLLRPCVVRELDLPSRGLELLPREPSSITILPDGSSLVLGSDPGRNAREIGRYSRRDAESYPEYERFLERVGRAVESTLDDPPPGWPPGWRDLRVMARMAGTALRLGRDVLDAARLVVGPARSILEEWFESEPLRATLATDAVIGAWASPSSTGTGAVLLHHVMGSVTGQRGVWAYVRGGMGELSRAAADAARDAGATLRTGAAVARICIEAGRVTGVELDGGEVLEGDAVISNADPHRTFLELVGESELPARFVRAVRGIDMRSPVVKVNLALDGLPPFRPLKPEVPLSGTLHLGSEDLDAIDRAFDDATAGRVSKRPVVELTIPSVVDPSLAPEGQHVASIFAQYAPALPADDPRWGTLRDEARDRVLAVVEEVAPGFRDRILHAEVLVTPDLESIFGLSGGNIFHGAMTPDRLLSLRPVVGWSRYRTPLHGLYLCGAGTHPGGGVMGACGRNAAHAVLRDLRRLQATSPSAEG
jgi:phytoene dehydrogenase-like protein